MKEEIDQGLCWILLSFTEDCKSLKRYGLNEYQSRYNLFEFLNPELSYSYSVNNMGDDGILYKVEKQEEDHQFIVTLKLVKTSKSYFVLDFAFIKGGFNKNSGVNGKNYLDTLCKIIKDEIIPYFEESDINILFFNAYNDDEGGSTRKIVFQKILNKYLDKDKYNTKIYNQNFTITKNER